MTCGGRLVMKWELNGPSVLKVVRIDNECDMYGFYDQGSPTVANKPSYCIHPHV